MQPQKGHHLWFLFFLLSWFACQGVYASASELASVMQRAALDRPVVDQTRLSGKYDFDLEFTPDETVFGGMLPRLATTDPTAKPEFFAAIQEQLGLKLKATSGALQALVIDRVERPTEN